MSQTYNNIDKIIRNIVKEKNLKITRDKHYKTIIDIQIKQLFQYVKFWERFLQFDVPKYLLDLIVRQ